MNFLNRQICKHLPVWLNRNFRVDTDVNHVYRHPKYTGQNIDQWILEGINGYKQWYQPVDFGNIKADVTTPPNWEPDPSLNDDYGLGRWNSIITRNLPDVRNKRILDVGCNVGLYSIELAKMGASEVVGIDRTLEFNHKSNFPPKQDIVAQASFVAEALEMINGVKYPVIYKGINFNNYAEILNLGRFDLILALNVIYHEYENAQLFTNALSAITDTLVIQTSIGHGGELAKWANLPKQTEILINAGFTSISIDCPTGYMNPVMVAKK
ncbi:AdoMet_MTases domain containing protein [actinobacterium SCGC AAA044-D11]